VSSESRIRVAGHLPGLDGVRGLAILMVMAVHFVGDSRQLGETLVAKVAGYGVLGVDLFFVLSGFLITGLLLDSKGEPHYFRNFYARRILRIFPLYYAVLAALFLLFPLVGRLSPLLEVARGHQAWLWTYTTNFFIAKAGTWDALTYVNHFWSLAIEEHFYLLWPLVVFTFTSRTLERICVGATLTALVLRLALALGGVSELSISVLTPCRIDTLCIGGLLALMVRRDRGAAPLVARSGKVALALGAALFAISAFCAMTGLWLPVLHQVRNSGFALLFGALVLLALGPRSGRVARLFQTPLLRFFGKYSYGLYVYHGLITWVLLENVDDLLMGLLGNGPLAMTVRGSLGFAVSIAFAVASYELYERRFLALKRHFEGSRVIPTQDSSVIGRMPPGSASLEFSAEGAPLTTSRAPPR
jgi:peptidoglycan/LPS O-acetylase OafA/YrhL